MGDTLREFETLLLLAVGELEDGAYGLALHDRLEERTGRSIALGQIYTGLSRLEQRGYVSSREGESTAGRGGRPKKFYRLEALGLETLRESRATYRKLADLIAETLPGLEAGR